FFLLIRRRPRSTLFPYTTLFRSRCRKITGVCYRERTSCLVITTSVYHRFFASKSFDSGIHIVCKHLFFTQEAIGHVPIENHKISILYTPYRKQIVLYFITTMHIIYNKKPCFALSPKGLEYQWFFSIYTGRDDFAIKYFCPLMLEDFLTIDSISIFSA